MLFLKNERALLFYPQMCESSDITLRLYAADALTMLVRVVLNKNQEADKKEINVINHSL